MDKMKPKMVREPLKKNCDFAAYDLEGPVEKVVARFLEMMADNPGKSLMIEHSEMSDEADNFYVYSWREETAEDIAIRKKREAAQRKANQEHVLRQVAIYKQQYPELF